MQYVMCTFIQQKASNIKCQLQVQMYKHTGLQLYETQKRLDI